jgi:hypothetical protein
VWIPSQGPLPLNSYLVSRAHAQEFEAEFRFRLGDHPFWTQEFGHSSDEVGRWALGHEPAVCSWDIEPFAHHQALLDRVYTTAQRLQVSGISIGDWAANNILQTFDYFCVEQNVDPEAEYYTSLVAIAIFSGMFIMTETFTVSGNAWVLGLSLPCIPEDARRDGRNMWKRWCCKPDADPVEASESGHPMRAPFLMVGEWPSVMPRSFLDDVKPTRALLATGGRAVRYHQVSWPGGVEPLCYMCVASKHCVGQYYIAVVFHYYSKNVTALQGALGWDDMTCSRITSSWEATVRDLQSQMCEFIDYRFRAPGAFQFRDYLRLPNLATIVAVEDASLGFAGFFDGCTRRRYHYWAHSSLTRKVVTRDEVRHVADQEWYFLDINNSGDNGYKSQAVCVIRPEALDVCGWGRRIPELVAFCVVGTRDQLRGIARLRTNC